MMKLIYFIHQSVKLETPYCNYVLLFVELLFFYNFRCTFQLYVFVEYFIFLLTVSHYKSVLYPKLFMYQVNYDDLNYRCPKLLTTNDLREV